GTELDEVLGQHQRAPLFDAGLRVGDVFREIADRRVYRRKQLYHPSADNPVAADQILHPLLSLVQCRAAHPLELLDDFSTDSVDLQDRPAVGRDTRGMALERFHVADANPPKAEDLLELRDQFAQENVEKLPGLLPL